MNDTPRTQTLNLQPCDITVTSHLKYLFTSPITLVITATLYGCALPTIAAGCSLRGSQGYYFSRRRIPNAPLPGKIESTQALGEEESEGRRGKANGVRVAVAGCPERATSNMPGVLMRDDNDLSRSRYDNSADLVQMGAMSWNGKKDSAVEEQANGATYINGMDHARNGSFVNGVSATAAAPPGDSLSNLNSLSGQLPPEIEHITFGYQPLSKLITRLVQETFNGLTDVINDLSEMQVTQLNNHAGGSHFNNHMNGNGHSNTSHGNSMKKLRLLNFAQDRRAQFIKTLVLSQWSRQAEEVGKVIDLKVWLDGQTRIFDDATLWMGELKRTLAPFKMPSPDLKTALEVLSSGKASWLPDVGPFVSFCSIRHN